MHSHPKTVHQHFQHPQYDPENHNVYDFAILKLSRSVKISDNVGVVCLPLNHAETFAGLNLTISGWGAILFHGMSSPVLKVAEVLALSPRQCERDFDGMLQPDAEAHLCGASEDTDTCQGDSGGKIKFCPNCNLFSCLSLKFSAKLITKF